MVQKCLLLIPFLFLGGVALTGTWMSSLAPSPWNTPSDFTAQPISLAPPLAGKLKGPQVLKHAIATLAGQRTPWLRTKIRQCMIHPSASFVAEGVLHRGPNHCVRLEMKICTDGMASSLLIVSDGDLLAQEHRLGQEAPVVVCEKLPVPDLTGANGSLVRTTYLANKGCGGPLPVLLQLQTQLRALRVQTGLLQGHAVIQLQGEVTQEAITGQGLPIASAHWGRLYLDAKTLWPLRIEWISLDRFHCPHASLQMEFREPVLDLEVPVEECAQLFSYEPKTAEPNKTNQR